MGELIFFIQQYERISNSIYLFGLGTNGNCLFIDMKKLMKASTNICGMHKTFPKELYYPYLT